MRILPAIPADLDRIKAAALADRHAALGVTHFLESDLGEVRGYAGIDGLTNVTFWSHTGNLAAESFRFIKTVQAQARKLGKPVVTFCDPASPFKSYMPSLGFTLLGQTDVYILND